MLGDTGEGHRPIFQAFDDGRPDAIGEVAELGVFLQNWSAKASAFHRAKENPGKKCRNHGPQRGAFPEIVLKKLKPPKAASGKSSAPGGCSFEVCFWKTLRVLAKKCGQVGKSPVGQKEASGKSHGAAAPASSDEQRQSHRAGT